MNQSLYTISCKVFLKSVAPCVSNNKDVPYVVHCMENRVWGAKIRCSGFWVPGKMISGIVMLSR
jgi:hypothetical protein